MEERGESQGRQEKQQLTPTHTHRHTQPPRTPSSHTRGSIERCIISLAASDPGWLGGGPAERVRLEENQERVRAMKNRG